MGISGLLSARRHEILEVASRHGVARVRVFGSSARGEATPQSDVDLLIDVRGPTPPWFPGGLVAELEAILGRPVAVVEAEALRDDVRDAVLQEAVPL